MGLTVLPLFACATAASHSAAPAPASVPTPAPFALPFIENDYPKALSEAKRRQLPIFVEAWVPY
jgi:hypothetical protein